MSHCIHNWNYGEDVADAEELLTRITEAGEKGLWVKGGEMIFATQLIADDKIVMCDTCERSATLA